MWEIGKGISVGVAWGRTFDIMEVALGRFDDAFVMNDSSTKKTSKQLATKTGKSTKKNNRKLFQRIGLYYIIVIIVFFLSFFFITIYLQKDDSAENIVYDDAYWMLLERKSNKEYLFKGTPGVRESSTIVREFKVKTGIPRQRPTPLPQLLGKEYWVITKKFATTDNPETAPYFIELDVPWSLEYPYGPVPYDECNGQCNWNLPGPFGLHGVAGDNSRLSSDNLGSSGCIRHSDEDIKYLYSIIDPSENIRYYVFDI